MAVWRGLRGQHLVILVCCVTLAFITGLDFGHWRSTRAEPPLFQQAPPSPAPATLAPPGGAATNIPVLVHVVGAVHHPGVQKLAPGARVVDALQRAGGATARADLQAINLAARLQDGEQIVVPRKGGAVATARGSAPRLAALPAGRGRSSKKLLVGRLKVNAASLSELLQLPGVGPSTAARILAYRSQHGGFRSLEDLHGVKGLGSKKLEKLKDHVLF